MSDENLFADSLEHRLVLLTERVKVLEINSRRPTTSEDPRAAAIEECKAAFLGIWHRDVVLETPEAERFASYTQALRELKEKP